jgi:hypothetical protein
MRRAVIEGAGPNGLLATFKVFRAGMDVDLVNDRVDYTRPQVVVFDSSWMCIFRYLLGTRYANLSKNPTYPVWPFPWSFWYMTYPGSDKE